MRIIVKYILSRPCFFCCCATKQKISKTQQPQQNSKSNFDVKFYNILSLKMHSKKILNKGCQKNLTQKRLFEILIIIDNYKLHIKTYFLNICFLKKKISILL